MTSRERVLRAIARQPTDRLPVDFGGTRQSGISVWAYDRLRKHLRLHTGRLPRVFDTFQMLAEIEKEVADLSHSDCVGLYRPTVAFGLENTNWKPFDLPDGLRVEVPGGFRPEPDGAGGLQLLRGWEPIGSMPSGSFYFDRLEKSPGALHVELDSFQAPRLDGPTLDHYHQTVPRLFHETDKAIVAPLGPPYELFYGLGQGGFTDWMITFATEPEYVDGLYHELTDAWIDNLKRFHQAVGDCIQILQICDDFGTQTAPFLSTSMFRSRVLPAYRRGTDWIHQHTSWKIMLHSDGAIAPLLPSIIEMGIDILNPVQTSATGMDPSVLKAKFGQQLTFWGGSCDPQSTLTHGTPDEVVAECERHRRILGEGGGYVFAPIHNIQANVPPENIVAWMQSTAP